MSQSNHFPGQAVFVGTKKQEKVVRTHISFDANSIDENQDVREKDNSGMVNWINVDGLHDVTMIKALCESYAIHPLIVEDILNTSQRPKIMEGEAQLFVVLRMPIKMGRAQFKSEQISFVLKGNTLLSFQERTGDVFDSVRVRLREGIGRIRKRGADYLLYALLDTILNSYYDITTQLGNSVEDMEIQVLKSLDDAILTKINNHKIKLSQLGRNTRPIRDMLIKLTKTEHPFFEKTTRPFLQDLQEMGIQVNETVEYYKSAITGQLAVYSTNVSNRLNDIMKVLTIFSALFIPLTFIAGIYGMNFNTDSPNNMPELNHPYGYFITLGVMLICAIGMLFYFKRKKWM